jgi:hypothetical protein
MKNSRKVFKSLSERLSFKSEETVTGDVDPSADFPLFWGVLRF